MSAPQTQVGYVYEGGDGKAFHIRFYAHEGGKRKQRSVKLCNKDSEHSSKDAPSVVALAEAFIATINTANAVNDLKPSHSCPICGTRCKKNLKGRFTPRQTTSPALSTMSAGVSFASGESVTPKGLQNV
jgi:hypothetical protein